MQEPEPTIMLTRKQLLLLGGPETLVDLLTFSNVQLNNTDAPEPTVMLTRKQLLLLGVPQTLVDLLTFSNVQSNEPALSVDRVSPGDQTETRSAIEMTEVKLNDLPELPFELILSYLSLEDRIKSRAVSRRWYKMINSFKAKSLCFSMYPSAFITYNSHWVIGEFVQNFINSTKFEQFFQTFGQSILANLKYLRLCKLDLNAENTPASFVQILNSFGRLEELGLFEIGPPSELGRNLQVRLNLPMLKSVQLGRLFKIKKLTLDAPRLQSVKLVNGHDLEMELVHGESVEKLIIDRLENLKVKTLKNLKYLYCGEDSRIDSTLLSNLEQLVEIHLHAKANVSDLFKQKAQYGRSNLKIFLSGCHLNAPDDPAIDSLDYWNERCLGYLAEHSSRLAEEIPIQNDLHYSAIEALVPGQEIDLLKRFTDLEYINIFQPVQDVERLLELLKNFDNIVGLIFNIDQQSELYDRLPGHCAIRSLGMMINAPADLNFLFRLKSLTLLIFCFSTDIEIVLRVLEKLPFLSFFLFKCLNKEFVITTDHSKQFTVSFIGKEKTKMSDVNAVVQWISKKAAEDEGLEDEESEDEE